VLTLVAAGTPAAVARAEACPNEQIRTQEVYAPALPDCRAYEQVSPVAKNLTDAAGQPGIVQASPSGNGISYFAVAPFPGMAGSAEHAPTYLSVRSPGEEWLTEGLLPSADPGSEDQVLGLSEDLTRTVLAAGEPQLAPGAVTGPEARNSYVLDNATGVYQLLAPNIGSARLSFADATPDDTRILFETKADLLTSNVPPAPGVYNLYEWNEAKLPGERISLAGVLPDSRAPEGGSVAGPGGPAVVPKKPGGSVSAFYTQDTISENGSRVFFTASKEGVVYMREPEADRTVQVSAGIEPAYWRAATPDGSFVLYTEGEDLYRYNVQGGQREALASGAAGVQGTLGISDDGSYVYFVATAELADNKNGNGEAAEEGADNLYEWHEEVATHTATTTFIAKLLGSNAKSTQDEPDWRDYNESRTEGAGPAGGEKSSRVTPDGKMVLLSSVAQLTGYANDGKIELYLYDTEQSLSSRNPVCVSCNSSGMPTSGAHLIEINEALVAVPPLRNSFLTRNLSDDGSRVFFQTEEALVPGDTDGQLNVYEWERADPHPQEPDTCEPASPTFNADSDGCLYLISTGQSDSPSYFGDASASGDDVFFFTRQSLVGQDQDTNVDVYDARVDGGIAAQNPLPSPEPCAGETCRGPSEAPPVLSLPSSATLTGNDNLTPVAPKPKKVVARCTKGKKRIHGKCRKKKARKAKRT
jgi:hypothetical protein